MSDMPGPATCRLHPDRLAVKECPDCLTPVCGDCLVADGDRLRCVNCARAAAGTGAPAGAYPSSPSPGGATCTFHRDRPAAKECPNCGTRVCTDCLLHLGDRIFCMRCAPTAAPAQPVPAEVRVPWEDGTGGLLQRFWSSWVLFVTKPDQVFTGLPGDSGLWPGLSFAYAMLGQLMALGMCCGIPILAMLAAADLSAGHQGANQPPVAMIVAGIAVGVPIAIALMVPISLFVVGALLHLPARALGSAANFNLTFRIVGYIFATVYPANLIPYVGGGCIVPIWFSVLCYFAGRHALKLSDQRAIVFALVPVLLAILCFGGAVGFGFLAAAMESAGK